MTGPVLRFLRFVAYVDGRTRHQLSITLDCSAATLSRFAKDARAYGMAIETDGSYRYVVKDPGPFDIQKLRQLPWRTMGRKQ